MAKKRADGEGSIRKRSDGRWEGRYTAGYHSETGKQASWGHNNLSSPYQAEQKMPLQLQPVVKWPAWHWRGTKIWSYS